MEQAVQDITAGSVGGLMAALIGHPFDTIKVRLQTQPVLVTPLYHGFSDCVRQTWTIEGINGFYRGLTSPLCGMVIFNAVQFMAYGQARDWVQSRSPQTQLNLSDYFTCGALTGVAVSAVESPMDLVKSQVQVQVFNPSSKQPGSIHFTSALDAAAQIWRMTGIRGIYQGLGATLMRNVPAVSLYFGTYEQARRTFAGHDRDVADLSSIELLCSGGVAGISYWLFTYPTDIIKSTMQTDHVLRQHRRYHSWIQCVRGLYQEGGIPRFFRGLTPCMLRAFPANAACFWGVEQTRKLFQ